MKNRWTSFLSTALILAILVSATIPLDSGILADPTPTPYVPPPPNDPLYDYAKQLGVETSYTYYTYLNLPTGSRTFETRNTSGADPVIYLFKYEGTEQHTWMDDNTGGGVEAKLTVSIAAAGTYVLLVRSKTAGGTADIFKDNALYVSKVPIAGTAIDCSTISKTGVLNYFTAYVSGDTRIWLANTDGKIVGFNDDYTGTGDFAWGLASRVKHEFTPGISSAISYAIISSYSPSSTGSADVYLKLDPGYTDSGRFPNLLADDSIRSSPSPPSHDYNCFAWAGGRTDSVISPAGPDSPWYDSREDDVYSFDNYFSNDPPRYEPGATTYVRDDETGETSSTVDLWRRTTSANLTYYDPQSTILHGSVKKPGDNYAHGYDWESKVDATVERIFHPRRALFRSYNEGYGAVKHYYTVSSQGSMTMDDAERAGLTVLEMVELTGTEEAKLKDALAQLPSEVREQFYGRFDAWESTWNKVLWADTQTLRLSEEYMQLLRFSQEQGKSVWPLLFQEMLQEGPPGGRFRVKNVLYDLTLGEFGHIMAQIREESKKPRHDLDGRYIAPSNEANMMKYVKELLALL